MFSPEDPSTWPATGELDRELVKLIKDGAYPRYTRFGDDFEAIRLEWKKIALLDANKAVAAATDYVDASEIQIPLGKSTMRALVYKPKTPPKNGSPLVVFIHGGAFVFGDPEFDTMNCVNAVREYGVVALSLEYTRAPEGRFPMPAYECFDALKWISDNASQLGADPSKGFIVGGNSAGGLITASVVHMAQDEALSWPLTGVAYSIAAFGNQSYLPDEYKPLHTSKSTASVVLHPTDKQLYPVYEAIGAELHAPEWTIVNWPTGHAGHPRAYFQVCGLDTLRDDSLIMEMELRTKWDKKTKVDMYPGLPHIFYMNYLEHSQTTKYEQDTLKGLGWLIQDSGRV